MQALPKRKKRQHHVWKDYLKAWATDGQVACLMEREPFRTGPINLAVEGDFYKLAKLDAEDEKQIRWLVIDTVGHPYVRKLNGQFLEMLTLPMRVIEANRPMIKNPEEVEQALDIYRSNILEDNHFAIEDRFTPMLQMIYQEDVSFYDDYNKVIDFFQYICMQHMRTKGIKTLTISTIKEKNGVDLTRTWDIISLMLANNLSANFYLERKLRKLVLIKNTTDVEFITGDQPTVNLDANGGKPVSTAVIYYPVSPFLALIVTETDGLSPFSTEQLTSANVAYLNARIAKASHCQIFGRSEATLISAREDMED